LLQETVYIKSVAPMVKRVVKEGGISVSVLAYGQVSI
jgi:hypothetical protein